MLASAGPTPNKAGCDRMADITMPQLGETVTEGTITRWFKRVGEVVNMDEALFEVSTDKVDTEVPSPVAGVVSEILAGEGQTVEVGEVLARVTGSAPAAVTPAGSPIAAPEPPAAARTPETPSETAWAQPAAAAERSPDDDTPDRTAEPAGSTAGVVLSPIVRRLIHDSELDARDIAGTGVGGRITRSDVESAIRHRLAAQRAAQREPSPAPSGAAPEPPAPPAPAEPAIPAASGPAGTGRGDRPVPLNNIRRSTAEHMVMSKSVSPHVLTAVEVDYEAVEQVRRAVKESWAADEGFGLTYLPFIARAVVDALRDHPCLNASFGDDELVLHRSVNLAIAVDLDFQGLLAPVVRGAEGKRLRQIARDVVDLATRARSRRLRPDDLSSGTFTITNAGSYGTMMQFPIINQPQVGILSTDGISRKPVAVIDSHGNEAVAVHSVGVLALAWDHRAFDGAYAASFLRQVRQIIETRDWSTEIG